MFDVSEKATEKIKELLGQRKNASSIRIMKQHDPVRRWQWFWMNPEMEIRYSIAMGLALLLRKNFSIVSNR